MWCQCLWCMVAFILAIWEDMKIDLTIFFELSYMSELNTTKYNYTHLLNLPLLYFNRLSFKSIEIFFNINLYRYPAWFTITSHNSWEILSSYSVSGICVTCVSADLIFVCSYLLELLGGGALQLYPSSRRWLPLAFLRKKLEYFFLGRFQPSLVAEAMNAWT